ncbi:1,4-dihydroxy-2-naphthoate octaprenyltransferase [Pseudozobellia thermophila]|uniref:1,4-dihydroxy-2-naphthoate octaprenyltransferase n=1 Tax=Pseudozobellia thermophila TaxID=192903 RepID=A0A1M6LD66_9FLAO|nr:1,4-dihydroxy-2-naphthoate octaprenyltransferase [Pseudozobellia thermophila]SHJ69149.1 1,4-dihydroxy-2-naphthoate prenyltransferase [Pseudozobellia thermophila]
MTKIKAWVNAARLRTLPLSVSGILAGTALGHYYSEFDGVVFVLALLTTVAFQVTSNFANDYGDGVKGTDNDDRIGPKRALQSGLLSRGQLKTGIIVAVAIDIALVMVLVYWAFGLDNMIYPLVFVMLGGASIWAAIKYTVGKSAYGYKGMGDIFVFVFFGLLAVMGSMFLYTQYLTGLSVLPAIAIGSLSAAVLNLNNMRDHSSDKKANKNTLVVAIGMEKAKKYHFALLIVAFVATLWFCMVAFSHRSGLLPVLAFVPVSAHMIKVYKTKDVEKFDPELKKLALSTFFLAVLLYISCNNFL